VSTSALRNGAQAAVEDVCVAAYTVPTDEPESDGTATWDAATIVVVEASAGGETGLGYTYAPPAAGRAVAETLAEVVTGLDAFAIGEAWAAMGAALRNAGRRRSTAAAGSRRIRSSGSPSSSVAGWNKGSRA
jgi:L-alanine-DL-glutamate epimerase-like enolase superfamily enzyme